jgi:hypothetical protein
MCISAVDIAIIAGTRSPATVAEGQEQHRLRQRAGRLPARAQAAIDDENKRLAEEQALQSERNAEFEAGKIREAGSRLQLRQRLAAVSQNVDPSSGSAAEAQIGSAEVTQEQVDVARLHGAWEAYGYRSQGLQFGWWRRRRRRAADNIETAGSRSSAGSTGVDSANEAREMVEDRKWPSRFQC